jgi:hypothetical protein
LLFCSSNLITPSVSIMNSKTHGIISLLLIGCAIFIAAYVAASFSILLLTGYLLFSFLSLGIVIVTYCAKCPCKHQCPHFLPGYLAKSINRQPGAYTVIELTGLLMALAILLLLPVIWLWHNWLDSLIYGFVLVLAIIEIRKFVCKPCGNINCPLNQKCSKKESG